MQPVQTTGYFLHDGDLDSARKFVEEKLTDEFGEGKFEILSVTEDGSEYDITEPELPFDDEEVEVKKVTLN